VKGLFWDGGFDKKTVFSGEPELEEFWSHYVIACGRKLSSIKGRRTH